MKVISLLGSTGSIGTIALEIVDKFPNFFRVAGLAAGKNIRKLSIQIEKFKPEVVAVYDKSCAVNLGKLLDNNLTKPQILFGKQGYLEVASYPTANVVLNAIVGAAGLFPTLAAIKARKSIALANKESLVMAGELIMREVDKNRIKLIPIDSEHSAIYQCLLGNDKKDVKEILLTASGGPFLNWSIDSFDNISVKDALKHPNWSMGRKITIDSATLMNKTLEIIEAKWLFGLNIDKIRVIVHPQSIIHSMVSYKDGIVIGQMGVPDMKSAIAYALSFPKRLNIGVNRPDFSEIGELSFSSPDLKKFPCLELAFLVTKIGGAAAAVMNASNEIAVQAFLDAQIPFTKIYSIVRTCIDEYRPDRVLNIDDIISADNWARAITTKIIKT